ncbi:MAG: hypothetical protein ACLR9T_01775 [Thomasclavelia sp.]|uniref:hypothetical protein n=1 Tax=Thomasclavelia sp. TaxID=3025757 RepID=UPI0039A29820
MLTVLISPIALLCKIKFILKRPVAESCKGYSRLEVVSILAISINLAIIPNTSQDV